MSKIIDLTGKTIIITGAGSGIGRETARVLSEQGARIIMFDLNQNGQIEIDEFNQLMFFLINEKGLCIDDLN